MPRSIHEAADLTPFAWIERGLRSPIGHPPVGDTAVRVPDLLPLRFASYAKIFHPIYEDPSRAGEAGTWDALDKVRSTVEVEAPLDDLLRGKGTLLRTGVGGEPPAGWRRVLWSELAKQLGLPYGPELSEKDLDRAWPGQGWPARLVGPDEGDLVPSVTRVIREAIEEEGDPGTCFFWWWMLACLGSLEQERDHLFTGPLHDLPEFMADRDLPSPTYWWSESRAWCVTTDYDLCFTVIGGPEALVARVLASPGIEGLTVKPEDALLTLPQRRVLP